MRRNPALDGVRGVAILLVFAYHLFPDRVPGGFIGVDLFFVLSGFLITRNLLGEHGEHGSINLPRFYLRRARRLLPALWVALAIVGVGVLVLTPPNAGLFGTLALTSALNVANITVATGHPTWAVFTWSLSAEEQFYLLWPPLLVLCLGRVRPRVLIGALAALALGSAAMRLHYWQAGDWMRAYYHPLAHADGLLLGCLLALAPLPRMRGAILVLIGVALTATTHSEWMFPGGYLLVVLACAGLVQAAAEARLDWARNAVLRFFGRISYALYIWSGLLLGLMPVPVTAVVTVALATGSYYLVERHMIRRPVPVPALAIGQAGAE